MASREVIILTQRFGEDEEFRGACLGNIERFLINVQGRALEVQRIAGTRPDAPVLIFLHEGLGCISLWRDFPVQVVEKTGCSAIVYSRYGYGKSDVLQERRTARFMHEEALQALPELLQKLQIREPILIGHSDGGSIALIFAGSSFPVKALVLMATHVFVEEWGLRSIREAAAAFDSTDLPHKLARHHTDPEKTFHGWSDIWLADEFLDWNLEEYLPRITCPVLMIQGHDDQYGTMAQVDSIAAKTAGTVETLRLENCKHSPHRDQPAETLETIRAFVNKVLQRDGPKKN